MTMPKTTVDKYDFPAFWKNQVGFSRQIRYMKPEFVSARMSDFPHQDFWFSVLASDERHTFAALRPRERIHLNRR